MILILSYPYGMEGTGLKELFRSYWLILAVLMAIFRKNLRKISKYIAIALEFVDVMR